MSQAPPPNAAPGGSAHPGRLHVYSAELAVCCALLAATGVALAAGTLLSTRHPATALVLILLGGALSFMLTRVVPGAGADGFREQVERAAQAPVDLCEPQLESAFRTLRSLLAAAAIAVCLWLLDRSSPIVPAVVLGAGALALERFLWVRGFETFRRLAVLRGTLDWTHARVFYVLPPTMIPMREPRQILVGSARRGVLERTAERLAHFRFDAAQRSRQTLTNSINRLRWRRARAAEAYRRQRLRTSPAPTQLERPDRRWRPATERQVGDGILAARPVSDRPGAVHPVADGQAPTNPSSDAPGRVRPRDPRPGVDRHLDKDMTVELQLLERELDAGAGTPSVKDADPGGESATPVTDKRKPRAARPAAAATRPAAAATRPAAAATRPAAAASRQAGPRRAPRTDKRDDGTTRAGRSSGKPSRGKGGAKRAKPKAHETPEEMPTAEPTEQPSPS